jgi:hypothetical protein
MGAPRSAPRIVGDGRQGAIRPPSHPKGDKETLEDAPRPRGQRKPRAKKSRR